MRPPLAYQQPTRKLEQLHRRLEPRAQSLGQQFALRALARAVATLLIDGQSHVSGRCSHGPLKPTSNTINAPRGTAAEVVTAMVGKIAKIQIASSEPLYNESLWRAAQPLLIERLPLNP